MSSLSDASQGAWAPQPRAVSPLQATALERFCRVIAVAHQGGQTDDPEAVGLGLAALAEIAQSGAFGLGGSLWTAEALSVHNGGTVLVVKGPTGDELTLHTDAQGQPFMGSWALRPGGALQEVTTFDVRPGVLGPELRLDSGAPGPRIPVGPHPAASAWTASPSLQSDGESGGALGGGLGGGLLRGAVAGLAAAAVAGVAAAAVKKMQAPPAPGSVPTTGPALPPATPAASAAVPAEAGERRAPSPAENVPTGGAAAGERRAPSPAENVPTGGDAAGMLSRIWCLRCAAGPDPKAIHPLLPKTRLGRARDNDIPLPDEKASRHHALITCDAKGCRLTDLGSANGTLVNNRPVTQPMELVDGDTVAVGKLLYVVVGKPTPRAPQPAPALAASPYRPPEPRPAPAGVPAAAHPLPPAPPQPPPVPRVGPPPVPRVGPPPVPRVGPPPVPHGAPPAPRPAAPPQPPPAPRGMPPPVPRGMPPPPPPSPVAPPPLAIPLEIGPPPPPARGAPPPLPGAPAPPLPGAPAPPFMHAQTVCPNCRAPLTPGAKFCGHCGQHMAPAPAPPAPRAPGTCPKCGSPRKPGARFCASCGGAIG